MEFVDLGDNINCSHTEAYSPVLIRLEGGNADGGFCVEDYGATRPFIRLYGDLASARRAFVNVIDLMPTWVQFEHRDPPYTELLKHAAWVRLESRMGINVTLNMGLSVYGVSVREGALQPLKVDITERLTKICHRFYNINA